MRAVIRVSALAVAAFLLSHATAFAQQWGRPQVPASGACFYEDINFGGSYFCATAGMASPQITYRMNNRISSIRLFGSAEVTVYQEYNFTGRSRTIGSDLDDLRRGGWNDRITSYRVRATGRGPNDWSGRWGRPTTPAAGACFYEHINFEGEYFCVRQGDRVEMVPEGTNDRISSIRLFGGAELTVFRDRDFAGPSQHMETSARDLRDSGWNDTLSSFRVETAGFGRGRGQGRGQGYGGGNQGRYGGGPEMASGRMEWRGRVDDRIHLVIKGRSVEQRTISGTALAEGRATFTSGLPNEAVRVSVETLAGRGQVRVVQQPARTNDFTAIIEIFDDRGGAQEYRLEVTWR
ncbi:MAG TPA: peptidase inhibitor family I36 protein [Vicinamibacterales bacterium]|nr:peptidase inhibitor family I36 protein [Vicinamibacterales bacterium]